MAQKVESPPWTVVYTLSLLRLRGHFGRLKWRLRYPYARISKRSCSRQLLFNHAVRCFILCNSWYVEAPAVKPYLLWDMSNTWAVHEVYVMWIYPPVALYELLIDCHIRLQTAPTSASTTATIQILLVPTFFTLRNRAFLQEVIRIAATCGISYSFSTWQEAPGQSMLRIS